MEQTETDYGLLAFQIIQDNVQPIIDVGIVVGVSAFCILLFFHALKMLARWSITDR